MNTYQLSEAGHTYTTVEAESAAEALEIARGNVDRANYPTDEESDGALYIDVCARNIDDDDCDSDTVTLEPEEPACEDGREHDWQSPYSVLGGSRENPGVFGSGGGVIIREVCACCGRYRVTNTWAQRPDTGEQGLREVRYEPADAASLEWVGDGEAEYVIVHAADGCSEEYVGEASSLDEARALAANPGRATPAHLYDSARAARTDLPGCSAPPSWYSSDLEASEWAGDDGYYAIIRRPRREA